MYKLLMALGLALAITSPVLANPNELICEHKTCTSAEYSIFKSPRCKECIPNTLPPGVGSIDCRFTSGSYYCEIWPRGNEISYRYSASSGFTVSETGPTYAPSVQVYCPSDGRSGTLFVRVTSPYGRTSSKSKSLPCRPQIEN